MLKLQNEIKYKTIKLSYKRNNTFDYFTTILVNSPFYLFYIIYSNPTMSAPFSNLYQPTFEMDESFRVNKWNRTSQEAARDTFVQHMSSNQMSSQYRDTMKSGAGESQKRYVTEISQITNIGDGFKKMKFNQMETLKELKQEYEILRTLPLQDEFLKHSHTKKQNSSEFEGSHVQSQSRSSSSKQNQPISNKKHHHKNNSQNVRNTQILTLEKRQLQLVIGNSMRKIEELLNNEIEYKKNIHQLQLQLDSRNTEDKLENLTKTMKRNEADLNERIESQKKEIERLKQANKQLQQKNDTLQAELIAKNQQLRKSRDEKRALQDEVRLSKDKYSSLEIDMKRKQMERELLEKEKNSEINRLNGLLSLPPKSQTTINEMRKLEDELRNQKQRYEILLGECERYKRQSNQPMTTTKEKNNDDQIRMFESLIDHLKEASANQSKASIDLINSIINKMEQKYERKKTGNDDGGKMLEQLFQLRSEVTSLKREKEGERDRPNQLINSMSENVVEYKNRIKQLEDVHIHQSQEIANKESAAKEYEVIRSSLEYAQRQQDKLSAENQQLRKRLNRSEQQKPQPHQDQLSKLQQKNNQYEETNRQMRRQLDELQFMAEKASKEGEFNVDLMKKEKESAIRLMSEEIQRIEAEKELLKAELNKMKAFYQAKIQQKNAMLQRTANEFQVLCQTKEQTLVSYKANSEKEMGDLIRRIESMAELNQRYLIQSTEMSKLERELYEVRYALKRMKGIRDGVDHLWQIKETEYFNINQILSQTKMS